MSIYENKQRVGVVDEHAAIDLPENTVAGESESETDTKELEIQSTRDSEGNERPPLTVGSVHLAVYCTSREPDWSWCLARSVT